MRNLDTCIGGRTVIEGRVRPATFSLKPLNLHVFLVSYTKSALEEAQSIISSLALLFCLRFGCVTSFGLLTLDGIYLM